MSKRQQLLGMRAMLDHVTLEANRSGYALISTLAAAASEAVRDELAAARRGKCARAAGNGVVRGAREAAETFAYAAAPAEPHR